MKKKSVGLLIVIALILLDLLSKSYLTTHIAVGERIEVIDGFFWLTHFRNSGAAWSILEQHTWILTTISGVAGLLMILYYVRHHLKGWQNLAMILIMAGTIGNFVDRLLFGYVRDFLSFNLFGYMFPVFNFADSFLTVGVVILLIDTLINDGDEHA